MDGVQITYRVQPPVTNDALNALFTTSWSIHQARDFEPILTRSLAYVCAYDSSVLVGFVNLAWDGGVHAFVLDTTVLPDYRRRGIGRKLIEYAVTMAADRGIKWVHVDYESHLEAFYRDCGFQATRAGLRQLSG